MVAEVIQYFLIMEQKRFPVKRNDLMKLVHGMSAKNLKTVIAKAQTYLDDVKRLVPLLYILSYLYSCF